MATKKKVAKSEVLEEKLADKAKYLIKLVSTNFIVVDKHGIDVTVKLPKEKIIKCKKGDLFIEQ